MTRAIYVSADSQTGKPRANALGCGWLDKVPPGYTATAPCAIVDGPNGVQVFPDAPPVTPSTVLNAIAADAALDASAAQAQATADAAAAVTAARLATFAGNLQPSGTVPQTAVVPSSATLANGATAMALGTNATAKVTPTATATLTTTVPPAGTDRYLIVLTAGTTSFTLTFGAGFKPTATLVTGTVAARVFVLAWISDGTSLYEVSRTVAMVA